MDAATIDYERLMKDKAQALLKAQDEFEAALMARELRYFWRGIVEKQRARIDEFKRALGYRPLAHEADYLMALFSAAEEVTR